MSKRKHEPEVTWTGAQVAKLKSTLQSVSAILQSVPEIHQSLPAQLQNHVATALEHLEAGPKPPVSARNQKIDVC